MNLKFLAPDWKKIIIFIILFLVLPQKVSNDFILFGGVFIIKSLFESYAPNLDLIVTVIILIVSYLLACLLVWVYDTKINKFIAFESEIEVPPPEGKKEKIEQKPKEVKEGATKEKK